MNTLDALIKRAETLNAHELDALISGLAEIRANTAPPVSPKRPDPNDADANLDVPVTIEDSPAMQAKLLRDGRIRLWARSSGFGWLAFNIDMRDAALLRDWFIANVQGESDLFSQSGTQSH